MSEKHHASFEVFAKGRLNVTNAFHGVSPPLGLHCGQEPGFQPWAAPWPA